MHAPGSPFYIVFLFYIVILFYVTGLVYPAAAQSIITSCNLFEEQGGLIVMEAESVLATDSWSLRNNISGALGEGYYEWKHGDTNQGIDAAGRGILTYTFQVSKGGLYRFLLRSSSPDLTEHNDVWVRFPGHAATGIRQSGTGSINIAPNSWFKVYQNTNGQEWKWDARTVDFDPHSIFLNIEEPGIYSVELSGRSTLFKIDRLLLFHRDVRFSDATRTSTAESACLETETLDLRQPDEPEGVLPGLFYAYYEGNWSLLPDFASMTPLATGVVEGFDISQAQSEDYFGFLFKGFVQAPVDGLYTFYTVSNAGSQLFIGDELVVDNDGAHATRERRGSIALATGLHEISVLFFEDFWVQNLSVLWTTPGEGQTPVGEGSLFYDPEDLPPPVEFVRFEGAVDPGGVALSWETASELNNEGFEIERRYDSTTQATPTDTTIYSSIAFIDGSGTSTTSRQYSYTDTSFPAIASVLHYRIKQIGFDGDFTFTDAISVELPLPTAMALYPNYPDPFNPTTTLAFDLNVESPVRLSLYTASGRLIEVLLDDIRPPGRTEITFTAPSSLSSGLYFYRLDTPEQVLSGAMTLVR